MQFYIICTCNTNVLFSTTGITEFTLSTLVATTQHFPTESIPEGGGHYQVTMVLHLQDHDIHFFGL
jgi:hypothetical protein